jgi:hypothetical protein
MDGLEWLGKEETCGGFGIPGLVESFNTALLAKQCWRFIKNPGSLAARVFKEKYFPGVPLSVLAHPMLGEVCGMLNWY